MLEASGKTRLRDTTAFEVHCNVWMTYNPLTTSLPMNGREKSAARVQRVWGCKEGSLLRVLLY